MTAVSIGPTAAVTCPPWCVVSPGEHQSELRWEGRTTHWSQRRQGDGWEVRSSTTTDTSDALQTSELHVSTSGTLSPAAAEALALTVLGAVEQARG